MQRDKAKVESSLRAKGFRTEEGDHHFFIFYTHDGLKTPVYTRTSHSPKYKSIGDPLLSAMSKQCHISKSEFLNLVDCPLSYGAYEALLKKNDII
jgi:hypothetical protein